MSGKYLIIGVWLMSSLLIAAASRARAAEDKGESRVFELRTYYAAPGKMTALQARFRDQTCKLFEKHGMTIIGFWVPSDPREAEQKLVYLLSFPSRQAAETSWAAFRGDPEWQAARAASERNGKLVERLESVYLKATDFSPLR
jgi:hypothetical protein